MKLSQQGCRRRQSRLLAEMSRPGLPVAVVVNPKHVLYLTGYETPRLFKSAAVLKCDGGCLLVSPSAEDGLAIDGHVPYEPKALSTLRLDQAQRVAEKVRSLVGDSARLGVDKGEASAFVCEIAAESVDLEPLLWRLRRRKDEDELAILKQAIDITHACYARAREILAPGVSELEVYAELRKTAVLAAGEDLPVFGNDFQCGTPGGAPRHRKAQAGELYILDLGPGYGGYNGDNCRTFAVDGKPTELQLLAWEALVDALRYVENHARPGVSCRQIYQDVKNLLDRHRPGVFFHHLGHGVGLDPHEAPNLNPNWDHCFEEGDFFTAEPGLYYDELRGGIRLEENYLMTAAGAQRLTSFPLEL